MRCIHNYIYIEQSLGICTCMHRSDNLVVVVEYKIIVIDDRYCIAGNCN